MRSRTHPRDQRHRHDEPLRGRVGRRARRCATSSVKSSTLVYGAGPRDPNVFREEHRRTAPARTAVERSLLEVEGYVRDFAEDNPHVTVSLLRFSNVLGPDIRTPLVQGAVAAGRAPHLRLRPPLPVRPRGRRRAGDPLRARAPAARHLQRRRRRPAAVERGGRRSAASAPSRCRRSASPASPRRRSPRLGIELTPELLDLLRYGRGVDNRRLKQAGFRYRLHVGRHRRGLRRVAAAARAPSATSPAYHYERDVEQFFRHSPAVARDDR